MLWSTRISSSRQVSGKETVCTTAGKPLLVSPGDACGISGSSAWPTGSIVTVSPGKRWPVEGSTGQSAKFVASISPGVGEHRSLKLPVRSASDGTFNAPVVTEFFSRRHSCDQKKNVFFLLEL